ncbi:MAG: hypothetical protein HFH79_02770 [Lachnospiraceae bacterium]|nr:hypothetical protein [Lachnospiraceae bacterium]
MRISRITVWISTTDELIFQWNHSIIKIAKQDLTREGVMGEMEALPLLITKVIMKSKTK